MPKPFLGPRLRQLREAKRWTLETCAARLGVSVSYLSQIETNQRPLSNRVAQAVLATFDVAPSILEVSADQRMISDLREACATSADHDDPVPMSEIRRVATTSPRLAREFLEVHRAWRQAEERLRLVDEAVSLGQAADSAGPLLPYEEVRDFFHYQDNYIHDLDLAAESLSASLGIRGGVGLESELERLIGQQLGVSVVRAAESDAMRTFDAARKVLRLNGSLPAETRSFQIATHLVATSLAPLIEEVLQRARLRSHAAVDVCRVSLTNYAAGALLMPYRTFADAARQERHDVERLALTFGASLEQVCHRLSNLQRPGERGIPLYFLRMDAAGNITKRHSATRFHFARFGGTCPLWNVHNAWSAPDRFLVQVVEMPDRARYLSVARSILKPSGSFSNPSRRYVLGFGCELQHAHELIYSDSVDLKRAPIPIGVGCRICERVDCAQRAFPPLDRSIEVPRLERTIVPFKVKPS